MQNQVLRRELKSKTDSTDSERAVIGGLLLDPTCIDEVAGTGLLASDFNNDELGLLYMYILDMLDEDEKVDPLSLRNWIDREGNHSS
jgi:replicative DNA helicase